MNYTKNKLDQLKGFCAMVECGNINDAAKANYTSPTTISKQISSLEEDLGFPLFNKIKNKLIINKQGKIYYKEAKKLLLELDKLYGGKLGVRKISGIEFLTNKVVYKITVFRKQFYIFLEKMLIRVTWKRFLCAILIVVCGILVYLDQTNYWFDRKLERLSSDLLKNVMEVGDYKIDRHFDCEKQYSPKPFDIVQFNHDILLLWKHFKNNKLTTIAVNDNPSQVVRFSGDESKDKAFNNKNAIICNTKNIYDAIFKMFSLTKYISLNNNNFSFYVLYKKTNSLHYEQFEKNIREFKNLFGIKLNDISNIPNGRFWFMHDNGYYYLWLVTESLQGYNNNADRERHLIFKKLTLDQLKTFDNGSYWKLIKEYNIKVD